MSEAKFTPGPWMKHLYNLRIGSMVSFGDISKGETVAIVMAQKSQPNGEGNAHLIAAAPDLFEALARLVDNVKDYETWQRPCLALDEAIAALSKARGE